MERREKVVLVAVDLSTHHAETLLAALEQEGQRPDSAIHLLSVLDRADLRHPGSESVLAQEEAFLANTPAVLLERMRSAASLHARPLPRAKVTAHARIGPVVETILQACVDYDVDLLICGTHARTGLARVVQGSVAEALVRAAGCPVLVARHKSYEGLCRTDRPAPPPAPGERPPEVLSAQTEGPIASTTIDGWDPSDGGPTGYRIV